MAGFSVRGRGVKIEFRDAAGRETEVYIDWGSSSGGVFRYRVA